MTDRVSYDPYVQIARVRARDDDPAAKAVGLALDVCTGTSDPYMADLEACFRRRTQQGRRRELLLLLRFFVWLPDARERARQVSRATVNRTLTARLRRTGQTLIGLYGLSLINWPTPIAPTRRQTREIHCELAILSGASASLGESAGPVRKPPEIGVHRRRADGRRNLVGHLLSLRAPCPRRG